MRTSTLRRKTDEDPEGKAADQLTGLLDQMSPETRKAVAETFAAIRPPLDQLLDKALAIPGVGAVIKPTVDAIRAKLDALAVV
jgi:hypothetical protein